MSLLSSSLSSALCVERWGGLTDAHLWDRRKSRVWVFFPLSLSPPIVYAALIGFVKCLFLVSEVDRLNIEAH